MKKVMIRTYTYRCKCGYELKVFLDFGFPQEICKCRKCGVSMRRDEN